MSLIQCPECGKDVSSEAENCIHCGYPLKQETIINGIAYDLSNELKLVLEERTIEAIKSLREKTGLGLADSKRIVDNMVSCKKCPSIFNFDEDATSTIPHCPTCGSTNIEKITTTSKAVNTALFGIFGTKRHKTFHCNSCKYEW